MASHNTIKTAFAQRDFKKVKSLLGVVRPEDHPQYPLLCELAFYNQLELARVALEKGWSVHTFDGYGNYPIHVAVLKANPAFVELLVKSGADVNQRKKHELHAALEVSYIIPHWTHQFPLHGISRLDISHWFSMTEKFIELGVDINTRDGDGKNILHIFSDVCREMEMVQGAKEVFRLCAEKGIEIDAKDEIGETVLMNLSFSEKTFPIAEVLIDHGASLFEVDDSEQTVQDSLNFAEFDPSSPLTPASVWESWIQRSDAFFNKKALHENLPASLASLQPRRL